MTQGAPLTESIHSASSIQYLKLAVTSDSRIFGQRVPNAILVTRIVLTLLLSRASLSFRAARKPKVARDDEDSLE